MTSHQLFHLVAAACEVIGTFLLAIEAIKEANLNALREKFFNRIVILLTFRIKVAQNASEQEIEERMERTKLWACAFFIAVGFGVILALFSFGTGGISTLASSIKQGLPSNTWLMVAMVLLLTLVVIGYSLVFGFLLYSIILLPFKTMIHALDWIEKKTASGAIGILGFVLFLVGVIVRVSLSWNAP